MKRVLLALALIGLVVGGANADPNNLAGAVLITHHAPNAAYTTGVDWCAEYYSSGYGIDNCAAQITTMDLGYTLFYVVAAFPLEDKTWCGTEFGFGDITSAGLVFVEWGACLVNSLEIPTSGWPAAGEGVAVVATDTPWQGNFVPTYYFWTYNYNEGLVPLDVDPAQMFAGVGNCDSPSVTWSADCLGAMGVMQDGIYCCPEGPEAGACCFDEVCELLLEYDCGVAGGVWYGGPCDPNPCPEVPEPGACCDLNTGECFFILETDCGLIGGTWYGGPCDPNPCPIPPEAACCVNIYECVVLTEWECDQAQGTWYPDNPTCDPNPCPTDADDSSWGEIKSLYR